jgi:hypothetical protein
MVGLGSQKSLPSPFLILTQLVVLGMAVKIRDLFLDAMLSNLGSFCLWCLPPACMMVSLHDIPPQGMFSISNFMSFSFRVKMYRANGFALYQLKHLIKVINKLVIMNYGISAICRVEKLNSKARKMWFKPSNIPYAAPNYSKQEK